MCPVVLTAGRRPHSAAAYVVPESEGSWRHAGTVPRIPRISLECARHQRCWEIWKGYIKYKYISETEILVF